MKTTPESRELIRNTIRAYPGELHGVGDLLNDFEEEHVDAERWRALQGHIRDCDGGECNTAQEAIGLLRALLDSTLVARGSKPLGEERMRLFHFHDEEQHWIAARCLVEACAIYWRDCAEYLDDTFDPPKVSEIHPEKWPKMRIKVDGDERGRENMTVTAEQEIGDPKDIRPAFLLGSTLV